MGAVAGLDWAAEKHDVLVADEHGRVLAKRVIDHSEQGICELIELLLEQQLERVAIERPEGLLVGRLLAAGIEVLAIHPNQVKAARERYRPAGGKSDGFDAFVLCELARTDHHRFPRLAPSDDETVALQALSRSRDDLVATRVELANRLRAELARFWPGAVAIFADLDSPIGLAFLERYPSPQDARGLGPKRLQAFLARNAYCGRRSPEQLLERLHAAPAGSCGEAETEARRAIVLALVKALRPIVEQIRLLTSQIKGAVHAHPDGQIFLALFRDPKSSVTAAGLIAEIGDNRARYPSADALAADAGMAPVAVESGKRRAACFRRGCDHRLRAHFATLADSTRHWHPWANNVYTRARARGCDHPHAIRILGRAWTRILWRCWQDQTPYNPARHGNLNRLQTTGG
ncbi:MAG: IS110 family transposase [Nocardioidaceae bacterium]|jgi:transposase